MVGSTPSAENARNSLSSCAIASCASVRAWFTISERTVSSTANNVRAVVKRIHPAIRQRAGTLEPSLFPPASPAPVPVPLASPAPLAVSPMDDDGSAASGASAAPAFPGSPPLRSASSTGSTAPAPPLVVSVFNIVVIYDNRRHHRCRLGRCWRLRGGCGSR
ncbi:hypothetical protein ACW0JT_08350 [Arthrobacter sp. SA17]